MKNSFKKKNYLLIFLFIPGCWFIGQAGYIHAKATLAQHLLEDAWHSTLDGNGNNKPWPWADTWPVARIQVPRLNADLIVLAGDSARTLAFGPGHNFASANPGEPGNSLISAHRDTHFAFLRDIKLGDQIIVETALKGKKHFTVGELNVVDMDQARFDHHTDQASLHLVTCYPFDAITPGGEQRYIVSAHELGHTPKKF